MEQYIFTNSEQLERILYPAVKSTSVRKRLISHLSSHIEVADLLIEYGLHKLKNGSSGDNNLYITINEIFQKCGSEKYLEEITEVCSDLPWFWNRWVYSN